MSIELKEEHIAKSNQIAGWPSSLDQFTPLMKQYLEIKYKHDLDVLLFFRVGDFYETFFEDAKIISRELEITLTSRQESNCLGGRIPLAGVPAKSVVNYVSKLLEKGYKVAICDQMEDPALAKGVVKREITKLLTPGTLIETDWLPQTKNNYLASIVKDKRKEKYGFAYSDVSCGSFFFTELTFDELISELNRVSPSELIVPVVYRKEEGQLFEEKILDIDLVIKENWFCTGLESEFFVYDFSVKRIKEELKIASLDSLGGTEYRLGLIASASILAYIDKTQIKEKSNFRKIVPYSVKNFLTLDKSTRKNLELTETIKDGSYDGSLMWAIDFTNTQMGKRRLRAWIEQPLLDINQINSRSSAIEELIKNKHLIHDLSISLKKIFDLERISLRLSASAVNPRELLALSDSLIEVPKIALKLKGLKSSFFRQVVNYPFEITNIVELITAAILPFASSTITDGNIIKSEYNSEIKNLREIIEGGHSWLTSFEAKEKQRTGIKNLKVGFNRSFGYFIEISKGNLSLVPDDYICRQTMVNYSRFITNELKDFEHKALNADQKIKASEYEVFCHVREEIKKYSSLIQELAFNISNLDVIISLTQAAIFNNYKKPILENSCVIELKASRHPVVEKKVGFNNFVPNDCYIEGGCNKVSQSQLMILTGPNMAGKSTYMRQIALNVILAQIGSFVACDFARFGLVSEIFTRVGATDDIAEGQSTFMVEMVETSAIISRMTERSLILLDEVGRGTSTYDGVAIAWALAEYLIKNKMPRTIFATHFHELNDLADLYKSIVNYQVTVKEDEGHVIFLRKVIPGGADKSYGIEVARMAGLPKELFNRAKTIMDTMHKKSKTPLKKESIKSEIESGQLSLFGWDEGS